MEKSKEERNTEIVRYTLEEIQKMITGFMPGAHVIEGFWNYRSGLKQKRVLDFAERLKVTFEEELKVDLDNYNFESEDFVDVFDSVMIKVQATKSDFKLERFKNIIVNHVVDPIPDILTLKYVEILDSINEVQLVLLKEAPTFESKISFQGMMMRLSRESFADGAIRALEEDVVEVIIGGNNVAVNLDDVDFYVNDLVSKGLIDKLVVEEEYDVPYLGGVDKEKEQVTKYRISKTGRKFLKFIKEYE